MMTSSTTTMARHDRRHCSHKQFLPRKFQSMLLLLLLKLASLVKGQECLLVVDERNPNDDIEKCDTHERCPIWKQQGECYRNEEYMNIHCSASCYGVTDAFKKKKSTKNACEDHHDNCKTWAANWECQDNTNLKHYYCRKSCETCSDDEEEEDPNCKDYHENCQFWAGLEECEKNPGYMRKNCPKSCGSCESTKRRKVSVSAQETMTIGKPSKDKVIEETSNYGEQQEVAGAEAQLTLKLLEEMLEYMKNDSEFLKLPKTIQENCQNKHKNCGFWAVIGECEANEAYMKTNCAPACKTCHLIDIETRCPPLQDPNPALKPGDLNKMFQRIMKEAPGNQTSDDTGAWIGDNYAEIEGGILSNYSVVILSSPNTHNHAKEEGEEDPVIVGNDQSRPPWVVIFEDFLTDEECDSMIELGYKSGYKRSEDVGKTKFDGTFDSQQSKGRTSENAWCSFREGCRDHPTAKKIHNRLSYVMRIPANNSEDFQILKYEKSQFYNTHHDYIPHQRDRQCGPRVLTFFMYLSDVEAGGGTDFPTLGITVNPKKGRAVLWPSVYNADPLRKDPRTDHQALPVEEGTKFAANGWIHQYDYITPQSKGCN